MDTYNFILWFIELSYKIQDLNIWFVPFSTNSMGDQKIFKFPFLFLYYQVWTLILLVVLNYLFEVV